MKKEMTALAISLMIMTAGCGIAGAQETAAPQKPPMHQKMQKPTPEQMKAQMEKRVEEFNKYMEMTPEQIEKAKQIRVSGHQKIKPIVEKKRALMDEIGKINDDYNISAKDQEKKTEAIKKQIHELDLQAKQIRLDNEKAFVGLLNPEQKAKYAQIKEEGRKHYKEHKRPQGPENFGKKPGHAPHVMPNVQK